LYNTTGKSIAAMEIGVQGCDFNAYIRTSP